MTQQQHPFRQPRRSWARWLEKLALSIERPVNQLIGNRQFNPFYHTGPLALFLLAIVAFTGFYIFLFFQYGFDASYNAVATRIEEPFLARIVRATHRYASGALVITTLLHAFRTLFMERFSGPRWLAWITGILMTFVLWLAGITGYWLVWDERAQLINEHFIRFLQGVSGVAPAYVVALLRGELSGVSWQLFFAVFVIHVALFLLVAGFFLLHIRHLRQVRWLPESTWLLGATAVLLLISALFPTGLLPQASFTRFPGPVTLDPIFLYYLPLVETGWSNWLWGFMWVATLIAAALPWWRKRDKAAPARVRVIEEKCTGCTKCASDCPYGALEMVPRNDDSGHKLLAVAHPEKCVSCAICVGSCDTFFAITLGDTSPKLLWEQAEERLANRKVINSGQPVKMIFTCERHAAHGAAPFLAGHEQDGLRVETVVVPCTGSVPPSLLPHLSAKGAAEVEIVGCPPYDCANRLGNMLEEQRVTNERVPRLRKRYDHVPITAVWLAPDEFAQALPQTAVPEPNDDGDAPDYLSGRAMLEWLSWRNVLAGVLLLAIVLVGQIWFTGLPFTPYAEPPAMVRLVLEDVGQGIVAKEKTAAFITLHLVANGAPLYEAQIPASQLYAPAKQKILADFELPPGEYELLLYWEDTTARLTYILDLQQITLTEGEIFYLHDLDDLS